MIGSSKSSGWVYFIGGIIGIVSVSLAKNFSWSNYEFLGTEEDRKKEVPMTLLKRSALIAICVIIAVFGAIQIQQDHNWNPLTHSQSINTLRAPSMRLFPGAWVGNHKTPQPLADLLTR